MKTLLLGLLEQLKATAPATKTLIGAALATIVAVVGAVGWAAGRPHFKLLYSGLDAQRAATVQAALAGGAIRYEVSQPPAPFVIHVDDSQYYAAQNLVALSGGLESAPEGIQTNGTGAAQVFLSAPERAQSVLKREWQELEKQLEELDFVMRAHVSTSTPDPSPLRRSAPMTVAVTLQLRGGTALDEGQAETVAKLVRYRFNVPEQNVVISDQSGRSLYDGAGRSNLENAANRLFAHKSRYDSEIARTTNEVLDRILGPGMAYVIVQSDWRSEESETVRETLDGKPVVVSRTESKTSTPQSAGAGSEAGGIVGTSADPAAEFGTGNAALPAPASPPLGKATTQDTQTNSVVGRATEHKKNIAPSLERLSVSLFVDESQKERLESLAQSVKAAVGFVDARDSFSSMATPFASLERDSRGQIVQPPAPPVDRAPNRTTEMLIERGVEILCALAFLFVLFKSLKRAVRTSTKSDATAAEIDDPELVEMLAKRQVEELVKSDPDKVGSILARWASEEHAPAEPAETSR